MSNAPIPLAEQIELPEIRPSFTHKRMVCGFKCYITVSFFDGPNISDSLRPAEVFIKIAKQGSVIAGLMDGLCALVSTALQFGVPWNECKKRFEHHIFGDPDENHKSLLDGLVKGVDHLIEHRRSIIGDESSPEPEPLSVNRDSPDDDYTFNIRGHLISLTDHDPPRPVEWKDKYGPNIKLPENIQSVVDIHSIFETGLFGGSWVDGKMNYQGMNTGPGYEIKAWYEDGTMIFWTSQDGLTIECQGTKFERINNYIGDEHDTGLALKRDTVKQQVPKPHKTLGRFLDVAKSGKEVIAVYENSGIMFKPDGSMPYHIDRINR